MSTITANSVALPPGQLERSLYEGVNKVLTNAGGRWNRSAKAHVFGSDPRPLLGLAMETGKTESQQQKFQSFYTPPELAAEVVQMADVCGKSVLEPSAGHGALADECRVMGAKRIRCIEINTDSASKLDAKGYDTTTADFLTIKPELFDRVVMNPPFTKNQDIKHVTHALTFLKPGGKLVSIMAGNANRPWFKALKHKHSIKTVEAGAFKDSGTDVRTLIITIEPSLI